MGDIILILLFVGVGISGLYMSLKSLPCFAGEAKKREKKKGEEEGNSSSKFGDSNLTQVRPTGRRLSRQITMQQMQTVVTKDKVNKLEESHAETHKAALDKIRKKKEHAGARVRQRLIERRKLKSGSEGKSSSSSSSKNDDYEKITPEDVRGWTVPKKKKKQEPPSEQSLAMVEKVRSKMQHKIQTLQRLRGAFAKLDVDANGMLSKGEFEKLVSMILKTKKSVDKNILDLLWDAAWEQRKHGVEDELDTATLGHWL